MASAALSATQNIYTWDDSAGDGNWFNAANWTGPGGDGIPGDTQNPAGDSIDQALIGDISGTINYSPGTPTTFDMLNISKADTASLTVNINGDMNVQHSQTGGGLTTPNWSSGTTVIGGSWTTQNLTFNLNSGTVAVKYGSFSSVASPFYIAPGATLIGCAGNTPTPSRVVTLSGASNIVKGWLGTLGPSIEHSTRENRVVISGGELLVDGGTLHSDGLFFNSRYGTLTLTNNAVFRTRFGSGGILHQGNFGTGYSHQIRLNGGVATNVSVLRLAGKNMAATGPAGGGLVNMQVTAGTWYQGGASYLGDGRVGILTVSGGSFISPSDVFVGGGRTGTDAKPTTAAYSGTMIVSGGTIAISNPDAGVVRTATSASRQNPGMTTHYFGNSSADWDYTYLGQRLIIDSLSGAGDGVATDVAYFAYDTNPVAVNSKKYFGLATTSGGIGLTGTANYSGCTYHTLPARLLVGNTMTFSDGVLDYPGTLNVTAGTLSVDEFVANMGAGKSTVAFSGGTFLIKSGSDVDLDAPLTVGNGTSEAVLGLGTGTHEFADGIIISTNAVLAAGGIGTQASPTVVGNLTLLANAEIHCDIVANSGETVTVNGALTLPEAATVQLAGDGSIPKTITLLTATSVSGTDLSGWTVDELDGYKYLASVSGNAVVLTLVPSGTLLTIR